MTNARMPHFLRGNQRGARVSRPNDFALRGGAVLASLRAASTRKTDLMSNSFPKLHNAMWPGLVGKGSPGAEPFLSLDRMLELTVNANVNGQKFDGVDLFLFDPHIPIDLSDDEVKKIADKIAGFGLNVGSLVAPVWPGTVGDSAMGGPEQREKFVLAVKKACRIAQLFDQHGVRKYGVIRIDAADGPSHWAEDPKGNTKKIAETFREAGKVAEANGERLAAEGEVCWGGMHSWQNMVDLLEQTAMPGTVGFQADLAHTYLYLLGVNAPEHALLKPGYSEAEFDAAYKTMTDALRPWTFDFHVAQNDGSVHGSGTHDKTGRHCPADDPNGKLDIVKCSGYWLKDAPKRGIEHICWDGCMFPNAMLEKQDTWNTILRKMIEVRDAHGWR
jgi:sugar phosphate isomerase/epimerase